MLDQLVESGSHTRENARRGGFLLSTLLVVCAIFLSGILWSLFAKDLNLGAGDFEMSTLIAPVPMPEDAPPAPAPQPMKREQSPKTVTETTRQANIARIDEPHLIPNEVSTAPNTQKSRPVGAFKISDGAELERDGLASAKVGRGGESGGTGGTGISSGTQPSSVENLNIAEPPPPPVKKEVPPPPVMKKSLGVVNGIAVNLVKPPYPPSAKIVRAAGAVNVQVTIDEKGNVVSANAVSGHPLLRQASETAARASKFNPTLLSNQPVKVTGLIVYKFTAQ